MGLLKRICGLDTQQAVGLFNPRWLGQHDLKMFRDKIDEGTNFKRNPYGVLKGDNREFGHHTQKLAG